MSKATRRFDGFRSPNYTMVPDELFDELLPDLTGAELKILLYITRRTFGFKRESDSISLSQMLRGLQTRDGRQLDRGAGLSKPTLLQALRSLEQKGIIETERRRSAEKGDEPTVYKLRFADGVGGQKSIPPVVKKFDQGGGQESSPGPWSRNLTTQKTEEDKQEQQHSSVVVVEALRRFGISKATAEQLAGSYPEHYVLEKLDFVQWLKETRSSLVAKSPAGYLRRALEDDYQPPPTYKPPAQRKAEEERRRKQLELDQQERREAEAQFLKAKEQTRKALAREYPPQAIPGTEFTTETAWQRALQLLEQGMTAANFRTWLKDTRMVSCDERTAMIVAPNSFVVDWLRQRFCPLIEKQLADVLGYRVEPRFLALTELDGHSTRKDQPAASSTEG